MSALVKQVDREEAWAFADFHCLPDRQMRERWLTGYYDSLPQGAAIQAFARHRTAAEAAANAQVEALGEALHGLSAMLLLTGALEDEKTHAAYEKVVARFATLNRIRDAREGGEA